MQHFQPDALTLSRGEEWRDRREFTEAVLATSERVHPFGERFVAVVAEEVDALLLGSTLGWEDFERLFDRLTLRVIFGDRARGDQELTELLETLMSEANRLVGLSRGDSFYELYGGLERQLRDPEPGSLLARFADAPQTDRTRDRAPDPALDVRDARHAGHQHLPRAGGHRRAARDRAPRDGGARGQAT